MLARLLLLSAAKQGYGICCQISHFLTLSLTEKCKQGLSNKACDKNQHRTKDSNYCRNPYATALYKDDSSQNFILGRIGTYEEIKM